jgi:hypothetical protein
MISSYDRRSKLSVFFLSSRANAELVPTFHVALFASHAPAHNVITKISPKRSPPNVKIKIPIPRSKVPAHNNTRFLILYLLHFPKLYPFSNVPLPEGRVGTAWELSKQIDFSPPPPPNALSVTTPHTSPLGFSVNPDYERRWFRNVAWSSSNIPCSLTQLYFTCARTQTVQRAVQMHTTRIERRAACFEILSQHPLRQTLTVRLR